MPIYMENTYDWACRLRFSGGREHVYAGCLESWNIPIGEDDTQEWPIWVFYREWTYRRKFGSRKCVKNQIKLRILLVWDAPQTVWAEN